MASEAAKAVALEVLDTVRKGKKPNKQEIQMKHGYTKASAIAMKATRTNTYKETINPVIKSYESIRNKILKEMEGRDVSYEQFGVLTKALNTTTHDIQLLSGGKTENVGLEADRETVLAVLKKAQG
jgi:hypothetical protein